MKLSVCIPAYNRNIGNLVKDIRKSALKSGASFEILIADDASNSEYTSHYQIITNEFSASLFRYEVHQGRAGIRNRLAEKARGEYLLFLDCDMVITDEDFVSLYLKEAADCNVVCGGISYQWSGFTPTAKKRLRYRYGLNREQTSATQRETLPYQGFMTGNFIVNRQIFLDIRFDEHLQGYGHEDTLFGKRLKDGNFSIRHINNAAVHAGIDADVEFITKTRNGLQNLATLSNKGLIQSTDVRLLEMALSSRHLLHRWAASVLTLFFNVGCRSLLCFDAWRLHNLKKELRKSNGK